MTDRSLTMGPLAEAVADIREHGYAILQTRIERVPARYRGAQCTEPDGCNQPATLITLAVADIVTEGDNTTGFRLARDDEDEILAVPVCDQHRIEASHDLYYDLTGKQRPAGIRAFDLPGQHMHWD
ncbi:hypothetical protein ACN6K5_000911 [Streptomyces violaceoruber]|uniref:hypothetical protein n=1 Tax=Streptomyces violaceoruber TaxID=1935 RepID=UPI00403D131A